MKFEIEKFYPGPGIEPDPLALHASALPLRHRYVAVNTKYSFIIGHSNI